MVVRSELDTDNGCSPAAGCCVQLTLRVVGKIVWREFQGHEATQVGVLGFVGSPIPPPPGFSEIRYREMLGRSRQCARLDRIILSAPDCSVNE